MPTLPLHAPPPPAGVSERRVHPRVRVELWMEELFGTEVYFRRTGNLSVGGAYFDRAIPHPVGTQVTLTFSLPSGGEALVARAAVVSAHDSVDGLGMSVKFLEIEGNGRQRLFDYIAGGSFGEQR